MQTEYVYVVFTEDLLFYFTLEHNEITFNEFIF